MFLLHRRFHYPPNEIHVDLNRRTFLGQNVTIAYSPTRTNDIDYLVIGYYGRLWLLYDDLVKRGGFSLVLKDGP